ncbi:MAG: DUF2252 family protein [Proteobacteria bacterium]|nr:DUF2252 family protein [Pseudomonadota bacterium]
MDIVAASRAYEAWAAEHITIVAADLALKHRAMAALPFGFLRATFYRWAQRWPAVCAPLALAPKVLAVGDLHIENFGTWRDHEGRLIWGINDFDEAARLPYTNDLVRLATSAVLAARGGRLALGPRTIAANLLAGYRASLDAGGRPYVLEETHRWMRDIALSSLRDPAAFWAKLDATSSRTRDVPKKLLKLFAKELDDCDGYRIKHRTAGLGSLGRQRFVALAERHGGLVAREAKAVLPSACAWADARGRTRHARHAEIIEHAVRCPDPFLRTTDRWIIRRLAADCSKLDLGLLPRRRDERRLLRAMGWETANIHLGTPGARRALRRDLDAQPSGWLDKAARAMATAVIDDWQSWRKHHGRS